MPFPKNSGGWRLLRTTDGSADTDWVGTAATPDDADLGSMPFDTDHEGAVSKLDVVLVVLDSSGDVVAPAGTFDLDLVEVLPRVLAGSSVPVTNTPVHRETQEDVPVGQVATFAMAGAYSFTIRAYGAASTDAGLDSVEIWYRVQRG